LTTLDPTTTALDSLFNSFVRRDDSYRGLFDQDEYADVADFYGARPELSPTPLRSLSGLADESGLGGLLVKDETGRFGLEAFKIAGARYAMARIGPDRLRTGVVCATAGNHGRAVARSAREVGVACTIYLPAPPADAHDLELATRRGRVAAMQSDGATTVEVAGSYEASVARAAEHARASGAIVVSDTSWPGYDEIPRLIMIGYTQLFQEASSQWDHPPDLVLIQGGVGGLVCAAANWFAARYGPDRPLLISCEPDSAACLLESARAGRLVNLAAMTPDRDPRTPGGDSGVSEPQAPGVESSAPRPEPRQGSTLMAGLRCAQPSPAAWPSIQFGIDAFLSIPDSLAIEAMDRLSHPAHGDRAIAAGPSGACGIGALLGLLRSPAMNTIRIRCGASRSTRVMAVVTEGP